MDICNRLDLILRYFENHGDFIYLFIYSSAWAYILASITSDSKPCILCIGKCRVHLQNGLKSCIEKYLITLSILLH